MARRIRGVPNARGVPHIVLRGSRIGIGEFIIEHEMLPSDDKMTPLREIVANSDIRPPPPDAKMTGFVLKEEEDMWDKEGWWAVLKRWRVCYRILHKFYGSTDGIPGEEEEEAISESCQREWRILTLQVSKSRLHG